MNCQNWFRYAPIMRRFFHMADVTKTEFRL